MYVRCIRTTIRATRRIYNSSIIYRSRNPPSLLGKGQLPNEKRFSRKSRHTLRSHSNTGYRNSMVAASTTVLTCPRGPSSACRMPPHCPGALRDPTPAGGRALRPIYHHNHHNSESKNHHEAVANKKEINATSGSSRAHTQTHTSEHQMNDVSLGPGPFGNPVGTLRTCQPLLILSIYWYWSIISFWIFLLSSTVSLGPILSHTFGRLFRTKNWPLQPC